MTFQKKRIIGNELIMYAPQLSPTDRIIECTYIHVSEQLETYYRTQTIFILVSENNDGY